MPSTALPHCRTIISLSVVCLAPLKRLSLSPCCVNYQQKRLQDSGVVSWHCHSVLSLSLSVSSFCALHRENHTARVSSFCSCFSISFGAHPPVCLCCFFIFLISDVPGCPDDFEPQIRSIKGPFTRLPWGGDRHDCFPSRSRESEARRAVQGALSGATADRGGDLIPSSLSFFFFFFS